MPILEDQVKHSVIDTLVQLPTTLALNYAGFTSAGVAAGSAAAAAQGAIGNVAAGSMFAALQSAGATGAGAAIGSALGAAGGAVGGIIASGLNAFILPYLKVA